MKIKTKISLGLLFLFLVILLTGGLGLWYLHQLSNEAKNILKDNYETIEYSKRMLEGIENGNSKKYNFDDFEKNLIKQEHNITEIGEKEATENLRQSFEEYKKEPNESTLNDMRKQIYQIMSLNMNGIVRKNQIAEYTTYNATKLLSFVLAIVFLVALTFVFNFPNYIAEPIAELTEGIKQIAAKNYDQRLHFRSDDEFGELAKAFNSMAEKLNTYENSNLAKLLFEKQRIETIINNMNDAIIGLDEKNNILFANRIAAHLLGIGAFDLVGKYAPDVAISNDLLRRLLQVDANNNTLKIATDGKESYFTKEFLEVKDPIKEESAGTVIILKNITKFQELDLAKTNFIATISHELKTPISAIKMSLKLLEDNRIGLLNDEQRKLANHIKEDSQRLLKITGELLDLTQVESGKIHLNQQATPPTQVISYATNAVHSLLEQKNIQLDKHISGNLPEINVDLEKTAWVMVNLLTNAIKHSSANNKIILSINQIVGKVQFSVQDFGTGIEAEFKEKIFDKFFQAPSHPNLSKSGTGLGLAISKDFIEAQGGQIWVESEINKGSTFFFSLPVL